MQPEHWCGIPEPIYLHPEPEGSPDRQLALPATRGAAVNQPGPYGIRLTGHRTALRHGSLTVQYARRLTGSAGVGAALPRRSLLDQRGQSIPWRPCCQPARSALPPRPEGRGFRAGRSL